MIERIKTEIIPVKQQFVGVKGKLDLKAICTFAATGFFLDDDTYFLNQKVLKPAREYILKNNSVISENQYFEWHYTPRYFNLDSAVKKFAEILENTISEHSRNKRIILPLSGGLDSRSMAAACFFLGSNVNAYSYEYLNGHKESEYGEKISKECNFGFKPWKIPKGYLWKCLDLLADLNQCYTDFLNPRSMAFHDLYADLGDIFLLGHGGNHYDDLNVSDQLDEDEQVVEITKMIVKKGGLELADMLWKNWNIEGNFGDYFRERVFELIKRNNIKNSAKAQIRAFKSMNYYPRWTSVNLQVFSSVRPIILPFYSNELCEFLCKVDHKLLAGRKLHIEYIKLRAPNLGYITWQNKRPYNLYNYFDNNHLKDYFIKALSGSHSTVRKIIGKRVIQRNWELQLIGHENDINLRHFLFANKSLQKLLPLEVANYFYQKFRNGNYKEKVFYSHPVAMLLTLSMFAEREDKTLKK